jgi:dethiobiotin synthetase
VPSVVLITGTGTEIGKTHTASALLRRVGRTHSVLGYKPIESGVLGDEGEDGARLRAASTFHVKHRPFTYLLKLAVSPHLAARAEGITIDLTRIAQTIHALRPQVDLLVVELAGGLYSPVAPGVLNADLVRLVPNARVFVVAPDRLGVLHDLGATTRAALRDGLRLDAIVLSSPAQPDTSTGSNAAEVPLVTDIPVVAVLPREPEEALAASPVLDDAARLALSPPA